MIEESAQVVALEQNTALLQTQRKSACQSCSVKSGCGTSVLSGLFGQRYTQLRVPNTLDAKIGDEVLVGVAENALVQVSLLMYLLPLIMLLAGAMLAEWLAAGLGLDSALTTLLGGVAGFALALLGVRVLLRHERFSAGLHPVMLRIVRVASASH
jgi:sigma-E factor negative regulatory protein RseC